MNIVLVGTAYPMRGGIAHYVALLNRKLESRGHRVRVLSFKRQYPGLLFPGKTQADEGTELLPVNSRPLLDSVNPLTWIRAGFWAARQNPDLMVFKYWMPFFAPCYAVTALIARRLTGCRILFICDNIVPHENKPGNRLLTRLGMAVPDLFIVQSRSVRDDLLRFRPEARFVETPHPVYEIFPPAVSKSEARKELGIEDERVILYFGFIRRYKGLRYLVEAMPRIRDYAPVRLVVCGEFYEDREEILDLIRSQGPEAGITVSDAFIPNESVNTWFCAADLVVLPYVSATQRGIVQVAYHYDKPVVVTRVGGLPETVRHEETGYVVEPGNPDALAEAVIRFYRENREAAMTQAVQKEKARYSWDRMAESIETLARSS